MDNPGFPQKEVTKEQLESALMDIYDLINMNCIKAIRFKRDPDNQKNYPREVEHAQGRADALRVLNAILRGHSTVWDRMIELSGDWTDDWKKVEVETSIRKDR